MLGNYIRLIALLLLVFSLTGFTSQPMDERKAQDNLPRSKAPLWQVLSKSHFTYNESKGLFSAHFDESVKALVGQEVELSGFILPLESDGAQKHFLLSKRTPTCPFCPPGGPDEMVEITLVKPVEWTDNLIRVRGTFAFTKNAELGLFYQLRNARVE